MHFYGLFLTSQRVLAMWPDRHCVVRGIRWSRQVTQALTFFADTDQTACVVSSILDAWDASVAKFDAIAAANGGTAFDPAAYIARLAAEGNLQDRFGNDIAVDDVLGGATRNMAGNLTGASVIRHDFDLRDDAYLEADTGEEVDPAATEWELAMDEAVGTGYEDGFQATLPAIHVVPVTGAGYSAEVSAFIQGDLGLVGAAVGIIIVYVFLQFSECSVVGARFTLAAAGIATVGLALGVAYGLGSITSPNTPVHSVLAFLLFGIGVDDVFVIAGTFSRSKSTDSIPRRVASTLQHAGSSVLLTSVTDALAFGISATTSLPALSSFTLWALYGIVGAFIMSCTFFTAIVTLDARRQEAGRYDCLCCLVNKAALEDVQAAKKAQSKRATATASPRDDGSFEEGNPVHSERAASAAAADAAGGDKATPWGARTEWIGTRPRKVCLCVRSGLASEVIEYKLAPALVSLPGQIAVGIFFAGLLAVASVGVANLKQEFREEWFLPEDSYLQQSFVIRDRYFSGSGFPVWAYVQDVHPARHPALFPAIEQSFRGNKYINTDTAPLLSWYSALQTFLQQSAAANASGSTGACSFPTPPGSCPCADPSISSATVPTDEAQFDGVMEKFLCSPINSFWKSQIVFQDPSRNSGVMHLTRIQGFYRKLSKASDEADAMLTYIDDVNDAAKDSGFPESRVFAYSFIYREWESYVVVPTEAVTNVGLSIACVFVVLGILLADLVTSLLVTLVVGSCLLNILGFMHFWEVSLDGVSVVFLVLAVGISIDYSAHIAHSFLHNHAETRAKRVTGALGEMGVSVINGAASTFLAVIVLSPSESYIFRVLFRVFFLSSVLGALHGLVLLPVVLLWFGSNFHEDRAVHLAGESDEADADVEKGGAQKQSAPMPPASDADAKKQPAQSMAASSSTASATAVPAAST